MARKIVRRPATRAPKPLQPRDFVLAGIGAVSLGRKQVIQSYADGFDGIAELRSRTETTVKGAVKSINAKVTSLGKQAQAEANKLSKQAKAEATKLRKQAKAKVAPVQKKVIALATEAKAQAEKRFAPVLAKLGIKKAPTRRAATKKKPAAKRPASKRPVKRARRAA